MIEPVVFKALRKRAHVSVCPEGDELNFHSSVAVEGERKFHSNNFRGVS